jgi:hypothetical protein
MQQFLNNDLKKMIFDKLETPSAYAIKKEITRILHLIEQNNLTNEQTLWSINRIYWFEVSLKKDLFYNHNIDQIAYYDLEIALGVHKNNYSHNDTLSDFEKRLRYNSLLNNLNKKLRIKIKHLRWSEDYYKKLFDVYSILIKH